MGTQTRSSHQGESESSHGLQAYAHSAAEHLNENSTANNVSSLSDTAIHTNIFTIIQPNLKVSLAITSWYQGELSVPFRYVKSDVNSKDSQNHEIQIDTIHYRNETIYGLGDPSYTNRFRIIPFRERKNLFADILSGVSFPVGKTEKNPFTLGDNGKEHQHVFFGSGTFDPSLGLELTWVKKNFAITTNTNYKTSLYDNDKGFRGGAKTSFGLGFFHNFGLKSLSFSLQPELFHEEPDRWNTGDFAENSGRTDINLSAGFFWAVTDPYNIYTIVKIPFNLSAQGEPLDIPLIITLGMDYRTKIF